MNYYNIDKNRYYYLKNIFENNNNIVLSWDRKTGKSNYTCTYLLDKLLNNNGIKILLISNNKNQEQEIIKRMYFILNNYFKIDSDIVKSILESNNSELKFIIENRFNNIMIYNYDIILIDDIDLFNNKLVTFSILNMINPSKIIITGDYKMSMSLDIKKLFNNDVYFSTYKNDKFLKGYMRKVKINRLESIIKV